MLSLLAANEISSLLSRNSSTANIGCTVASVTSNQKVRVAINWFKDGKPVVHDGIHYTITNMHADLKTMSFLNISKVGKYSSNVLVVCLSMCEFV